MANLAKRLDWYESAPVLSPHFKKQAERSAAGQSFKTNATCFLAKKIREYGPVKRYMQVVWRMF